MRYFLSRAEDHWPDSWTYGDWRQYMCKHADGSLQCARMSSLPACCIGACASLLLLAAAIGLAGASIGAVGIWPRIIMAVGTAAIFALPPLLLWRSGYCLMVPVGPRQRDNWRIFPGEPTHD